LTATGLGVPISTDAFIQHFVKDQYQAIMEDVEKLDNIQDGFIHYQLIRFCQATRLQCVNCQITLANQNVLHQHIDHHITSALLKKGTRDAYKTWNQQDRAWVDMRLHESHDEGGFNVSNNTITRHATSYTTNTRIVAFLGTFARPAQQVWLSGNELQDPTSWDAPPLCTLNQLHWDLLQQYDCTEYPAVAQPAQSSDAGSCDTANAGAHPQSHAGSQDNGNSKLLLPQLNQLQLAFKRSQVSPSVSSSSQDQQAQQPPKSVIPTQRRVTEQNSKNWAPFKALGQLALQQHEVRGAAPASPPPETQGHCRRLHSSSGHEYTRGASLQSQGQ
jgi:hypothetical protein